MVQAIAAALLMAPEARQGRLMARAPEVPAGLEQVAERAVAAIREVQVVQAEPVVPVLVVLEVQAGQVVQVLAEQVVEQAGRVGQVVQVLVGPVVGRAAVRVVLEPVAPATTEQWGRVVQQAVLPGVLLEALACQTP